MSSMYPKQQEAFNAIMAGVDHLIITGRGGCGKSYLIDRVIEESPTDTVLTATTGVAAVNINGATAHSVLSLPLGIGTKLEMAKLNKISAALFKKGHPVKRIIIDEASMISPQMFDSIMQRIARFSKTSRHEQIQLVLVGDFTQLGSITKSGQETELVKKMYGTTNLLESRIFKEMPFKVIELDQSKRQADAELKLNLERVRFGQQVDQAIKYFNTNCFNPHTDYTKMLMLCTTNKAVDERNLQVFNKNTNPCQVYPATIKGNFKVKDTNMAEYLKLKVGLRVMCLANDQHGQYVNGSVGVVKELLPDGVIVTMDKSELDVLIEPYTANNREYLTDEEGELKSRVTASFTQIPLRQAAAITIHKSQGATLEEAFIDLGNFVFAEGMTYVALSRLKTTAGIHLKRPIRKNDIKVNPHVVDFYRKLRARAKAERANQ